MADEKKPRTVRWNGIDLSFECTDDEFPRLSADRGFLNDLAAVGGPRLPERPPGGAFGRRPAGPVRAGEG